MLLGKVLIESWNYICNVHFYTFDVLVYAHILDWNSTINLAIRCETWQYAAEGGYTDIILVQRRLLFENQNVHGRTGACI
jgi:hypothetical protein